MLKWVWLQVIININKSYCDVKKEHQSILVPEHSRRNRRSKISWTHPIPLSMANTLMLPFNHRDIIPLPNGNHCSYSSDQSLQLIPIGNWYKTFLALLGHLAVSNSPMCCPCLEHPSSQSRPRASWGCFVLHLLGEQKVTWCDPVETLSQVVLGGCIKGQWQCCITRTCPKKSSDTTAFPSEAHKEITNELYHL